MLTPMMFRQSGFVLEQRGIDHEKAWTLGSHYQLGGQKLPHNWPGLLRGRLDCGQPHRPPYNPVDSILNRDGKVIATGSSAVSKDGRGSHHHDKGREYVQEALQQLCRLRQAVRLTG
jgi:hypothetical protein